MSLLEEFFILFTSNADEVKDGAEEAESVTEGLKEKLEETSDQSKKTGQDFTGLVKEAKKAFSSILALGGAATVLFFGARYSEELRMSSLAIGENVGEIEAWGRATQAFGGNAGTMQATLKSLSNSIRETAFTGEGSLSPTLRRLGLNLRDLEGNIKTPLQLLPEIADAFQGLDSAESMHLGEKLGLDQSTILLLQQGRREVELMLDKQRKLGVLTAKDTEVSKKFTAQLADSGTAIIALRQKLVTAALPALTWLFEKLQDLTEFMIKNKDMVTGFFVGASIAITAYYLPAMIRAAAATFAATWPILLLAGLVVGLIATFALLYDEIMAFSRGSDSVIGEAVKRWPFLGDIIDGLVWGFKTLGEGIKVLSGVSSYLFEGMAMAAGSMLDILGTGITVLMDGINGLWSLVKTVFSFIGDTLAKISGGIQKATRGLMGMDDVAIDINKGANSINFASSTPIASQSSRSIINRQSRSERNNTVTLGDVIVQTQATDAKGISQAIGVSLAEQMSQAIYNFDDGVEA